MDAKESPGEPSLVAAEPCLHRDEQCPLCGRDNQCRVAKGHLYKGPCWCHEIIVPNHILTRLAADSLEPACLCRPCLETIARIAQGRDDTETILAEVQSALSTAGDFYLDADGNTVFTAQYHLKRGNCCDSGCRHCPY
jgi:hypothetical protein